jgi:heterodisulfide reductase subunit C
MTDQTSPVDATAQDRIAGNEFAAAPERSRELTERILNDPRMHDHKDGFLSCIQCGICTSGCPAARFTEFSPRETARRALDGDVTLLEDDDIWYCFSCYTCQSRCPRHNSVAVINQIVRGLQVESGRGHRHVEMFAEWCANFYEKGMGGDPHLMFPAIVEDWGERWTDHIARLPEIRAELGLGDLYPPDDVVAEVRTIFEETGFKKRLAAVRGGGGGTGRVEQNPARPVPRLGHPAARPASGPPTPPAPAADG